MSQLDSSVFRQAARVFLSLLVVTVLLQLGLGSLSDTPLSVSVPVIGMGVVVWMGIACIVYRHLDEHPHKTFGAANVVTSVRAAMTLLLASFLPAIESLGAGNAAAAFWWVSAIAALALLLDGLDGKLARDSGLSSAFGARFDMETDAALGFVVTLLVWRSGELGIWVLGLGILRYLFLLAGHLLPALRGELYPSFRRKLVCVIQVGVLSVLLTPIIEPPLSVALAAMALLILVASFLRDVLWLLRQGIPDRS